MCVCLCLCIMAKQIKAMTSTLYLANEFIEVFRFKTISVINETILVSKITMALIVYRSKLCKILFLDSFECLICMDLACMYGTQKVKSYNNKIISAYFFCLLRAYHISSWYQHIFMGRISQVMLLCPIAIFV